MVLILMQLFYNQFEIVSDTNESIYFYCGIYFPLALMVFDQMLRRKDSNMVLFYFGIGAYFLYDCIYSLTLINKPYSEYQKLIEDTLTYEFAIVTVVLIILNMTVFKRKYFKKLKKKILWGRWN
jgi:hypothetical protein